MCSVRDTVELEKRGIPATTIITEAFYRAAKFHFRTEGMESHPFVQLPHPVSNLQIDQIKNITLQFVDEIASHLTGRTS